MRTILYTILTLLALSGSPVKAQINTDQMLQVGRNALYFEDYVLSIQYFNQIIAAKPHLAQPYFYRGLAKYNLDDFNGAIADATDAISRNPFITDAYELRGIAYQSIGKPELAVADYDKVLESLPLNRGILFNKALAQEELKAYDEAQETYQTLIARHPGFDNAYIGRARLLFEMADTTAARADIDHALELNPNLANAYILRAEIVLAVDSDYTQALSDMDMAIKLQPRNTSLYINRAFLRYKNDDYVGTMADYDYALQLDPLNITALYNRSLLRAEVRDYEAAVADLSTVLRLQPNYHLARYNRAVMNRELNRLPQALDDINILIAAIPDLAAAYLLRYDIRYAMEQREAQSDYNRSISLARTMIKRDGSNPSVDQLYGSTPDKADSTEESQEAVAARFSQLLTISSEDDDIGRQYSSVNIRGRVQDRNVSIEPEPIYTVTYYTSPTELRPTGEYLREVTDINAIHALDYWLQVTNREVSLTDTLDIARHFQAIDYYISYLSNHSPRAIDYFALGMSRSTLRQFSQAASDFERAISLAPDFALSYFMLGVMRYRMANEVTSTDIPEQKRIMLNSAIEQFRKAIELSPAMALAYFNMGVIYIELRDYQAAITSFDNAIRIKNDFGEAYFNRGYVYFQIGNQTAGSADLSTAGQLGIAPSYRLLKRMSK